MAAALLVVANLVNLVLFWSLWGGFEIHSATGVERNVSTYMALVQATTTLLSFVSFAYKSHPVAQKFVSWEQMPVNIDRKKSARLALTIGAFGFALTNIVVAAVTYAFAGTIDIWSAGQR